MLFNSLGFAIFLPVVFVLYWFVARNSLRYQNTLLLISSYFFYACWDWRFLFLLTFSTALDFYSGMKIHNSRSDTARKMWLIASIVINVGFLAYFKYCNFFVSSFAVFLNTVGLNPHIEALNIILPIGISFYTFHGLSYVFDIFNRKIDPTTNLVEYSLFVSFFPLLVAGPIERSTHLLPQIKKPRSFEYHSAVDGMRQMLWGFFKKIVIADGCADYVNTVFSSPGSHSGSTLFIGALLFSFQIYCDFSGYSDIALGTARLFGFELLRNFAFPYFSHDIAEFWRRWHISLSSWFKDYVYFPLGGNREGKFKSIRNTLIIFTVSGFWHGANWTYIIWGIYHGLLFLIIIMLGKGRKQLDTIAQGRLLPSFRELIQTMTTFSLVAVGWIFFRATDLSDTIDYFNGMFNRSFFSMPLHGYRTQLFVILFMLGVEWFQRGKLHGLAIDSIRMPALRWAMYVVLLVICVANFKESQEFIYFQF